EGDVAEDAHGERVGLLENHANVAPDRDRVDGWVVDVLTAEVDVATEAEAPFQVVHAIDRAQHRALAAAGRPDKGVDRLARQSQPGVADRLEVAVEHLLDVDVDQGTVAIGRGAIGMFYLCHRFCSYFWAARRDRYCPPRFNARTRRTRTSEAAQAISFWFS